MTSQSPSAQALLEKIVKNDDPGDLAREQVNQQLAMQNQQFAQDFSEAIRKFIKSGQNNALTKNRALKLVASLVAPPNYDFITKVGGKLLKKLNKLVTTQIALPPAKRGKAIFGPYEDENQALKFYTLSLECIEKWGNEFQFDQRTNQESEFKKTFKELQSKGVPFQQTQQQQGPSQQMQQSYQQQQYSQQQQQQLLQQQQQQQYYQQYYQQQQQQQQLQQYQQQQQQQQTQQPLAAVTSQPPQPATLSQLQQLSAPSFDIKSTIHKLDETLHSLYTLLTTKRPPFEVLSLLRSQWNSACDQASQLIHSQSQQWPLSTAEKTSALNISCQVVQQLNQSFQTIMSDTSKMNETFRVATIQTWDSIINSVNGTSHQNTRKSDSVDLFDNIIINTQQKTTINTTAAVPVPASNNNRLSQGNSNVVPVMEKNPFGDDDDNPFGFAEQPIVPLPTQGSQISSSLRQPPQQLDFDFFAEPNENDFMASLPTGYGIQTQTNSQIGVPAVGNISSNNTNQSITGTTQLQQTGLQTAATTAVNTSQVLSQKPPTAPNSLNNSQVNKSISRNNSNYAGNNNNSINANATSVQNNNNNSNTGQHSSRQNSIALSNHQNYDNTQQFGSQQQQWQFGDQQQQYQQQQLQQSQQIATNSNVNNNDNPFFFDVPNQSQNNYQSTEQQQQVFDYHSSQQQSQNNQLQQQQLQQQGSKTSSRNSSIHREKALTISQKLELGGSEYQHNDFQFNDNNNNNNSGQVSLNASQQQSQVYQQHAEDNNTNNNNNSSRTGVDHAEDNNNHNNVSNEPSHEQDGQQQQQHNFSGFDMGDYHPQDNYQQQQQSQQHNSQVQSQQQQQFDYNWDNNNNNNNNFFDDHHEQQQQQQHFEGDNNHNYNSNYNFDNHNNQGIANNQNENNIKSNNNTTNTNDFNFGYDFPTQQDPQTQDHQQQQFNDGFTGFNDHNNINNNSNNNSNFDFNNNNMNNAAPNTLTANTNYFDGFEASNQFNQQDNPSQQVQPQAQHHEEEVEEEQKEPIHPSDTNTNVVHNQIGFSDNAWDFTGMGQYQTNNVNQNQNFLTTGDNGTHINQFDGFGVDHNGHSDDEYDVVNPMKSSNHSSPKYAQSLGQQQQSQEEQQQQQQQQQGTSSVEQYWQTQKVQQQLQTLQGGQGNNSGEQQQQQQQQLYQSSNKKGVVADGFGMDAFGEVSEATGGEDSRMEAAKHGFMDINDESHEQQQYYEQQLQQNGGIMNNDSRQLEDFDDLLPSEVDLVKLAKKNSKQEGEENNNNNNGIMNNNSNNSSQNNKKEQQGQFGGAILEMEGKATKSKNIQAINQIIAQQSQEAAAKASPQMRKAIEALAEESNDLKSTQSSNLNNKRRTSIEEWALKMQQESQQSAQVAKPFDFDGQKLKHEEKRRFSEGQQILQGHIQALSQYNNQMKILNTIDEEKMKTTQDQNASNTNNNNVNYPLVNVINTSDIDDIPNPLNSKSTFTQSSSESSIKESQRKDSKRQQQQQQQQPQQLQQSNKQNDTRNSNNQVDQQSSNNVTQPNPRSLLKKLSSASVNPPQVILAESDIMPDYPQSQQLTKNNSQNLIQPPPGKYLLESEVVSSLQKSPKLEPRVIMQSEYIPQEEYFMKQDNLNNNNNYNGNQLNIPSSEGGNRNQYNNNSNTQQFKEQLPMKDNQMQALKAESKLVNKFERTLAQSFVEIPEQQGSSPERSEHQEQQTQQQQQYQQNQQFQQQQQQLPQQQGSQSSASSQLERLRVQQAIQEIKLDLEDFPAIAESEDDPQLTTIREDGDDTLHADSTAINQHQDILANYDSKMEQLKIEQLHIQQQLKDIREQTRSFDIEQLSKLGGLIPSEQELQEVTAQLQCMVSNQTKIKVLKDKYKSNQTAQMMLEYKRTAMQVERVQSDIAKFQNEVNSKIVQTIQSESREQLSQSKVMQSESSELVEGLRKEIQELKNMMAEQQKRDEESRQSAEQAAIKELREQMQKLKLELQEKGKNNQNYDDNNNSEERRKRTDKNKTTNTSNLGIEQMTQIQQTIEQQSKEIQKISSAQQDIEKHILNGGESTPKKDNNTNTNLQRPQSPGERQETDESAELFPQNQFSEPSEHDGAWTTDQKDQSQQTQQKQIQDDQFDSPNGQTHPEFNYSPIIPDKQRDQQQGNPHFTRSLQYPDEEFDGQGVSSAHRVKYGQQQEYMYDSDPITSQQDMNGYKYDEESSQAQQEGFDSNRQLGQQQQGKGLMKKTNKNTINDWERRNKISPFGQSYNDSQEYYNQNGNNINILDQGEEGNNNQSQQQFYQQQQQQGQQSQYEMDNQDQRHPNAWDEGEQDYQSETYSERNHHLKELYERTASHTLLYEQNPHLQKIYQDPFVLLKAYEASKIGRSNENNNNNNKSSRILQKDPNNNNNNDTANPGMNQSMNTSSRVIGSNDRITADGNNNQQIYGSFAPNRPLDRLKSVLSSVQQQQQTFHEAIDFSINSYKMNYVISNRNRSSGINHNSTDSNIYQTSQSQYQENLLKEGTEENVTNQWYDNYIKPLVKRVLIDKRTLKDGILQPSAVLLDSFELHVAARYQIVQSTPASRNSNYANQINRSNYRNRSDYLNANTTNTPNKILRISLTYTNKLSMPIQNLSVLLASSKGYENILADPAKIMRNVLLPKESINQEVYLPSFKTNSQIYIAQFSYNIGYRSQQVAACIPCAVNKFMDFDFATREQLESQWAESIDTAVYSPMQYLNTHLIQSCEDFRAVFPCLVKMIESYKQTAWRELAGSFVLVNDPLPDVSYLLKINYTEDERVVFQLRATNAQNQIAQTKRTLVGILELLSYLFCE